MKVNRDPQARPVDEQSQRTSTGQIPNKHLLIGVIALILIACAVFAVTVQMRKEWFGHFSVGDAECWPTGSTLKFTRFWYNEGAMNMKFAMLENPKSVEFTPSPNQDALQAREIYASYPPGCLLPIHAISKLRHQEPDQAMIMSYDLANHLIITICLSLLVFLLLTHLKIGAVTAGIFALVPIGLELLLPGPLFFHQNVFFADVAIIMPFSAFLLCEALFWRVQKPWARTTLDALQSLIAFYGVFTDWFFVFLLLVVFLKRWALGELGARGEKTRIITRSLAFFAPGIVAISLFLVQLQQLGYMPMLIEKGIFRMGMYGKDPFKSFTDNFFNIFWGSFSGKFLGAVASPLLWICLIATALAVGILWHRARKGLPANARIKQVTAMMAIALLPVFMHPFIFRQHASRHTFSILKLTVPLDIVPLVLLPMLILLVLEPIIIAQYDRKGRVRGTNPVVFHRAALGVSIFCFLMMVTYVGCVSFAQDYAGQPQYRKAFPAITDDMKSQAERAKAIRNESSIGYNDVLFSYDFQIPQNPPEMVSLSMKRVYKISTPDEIEQVVGRLRQLKVFFRPLILGSPTSNSAGGTQ